MTYLPIVRVDIQCSKARAAEIQYLLDHIAKCLVAFSKCYEVIGMPIDDPSAYKATRLARFWYQIICKDCAQLDYLLNAYFVKDPSDFEAFTERFKAGKNVVFELPDVLVKNPQGLYSETPQTSLLMFTHSLDPTTIPLIRNTSS